ncbi:MAG: sodium-dependent transporter [Acidobacteria bacterium]|nr:sodium-dependent transporter [Acidobacteriota bacterium]MBA3885369.1 sodium-dependent transporter [Acidobacteriota bacterium]
MAMGATDRGAWGSRMGFVLAAAGSAVGLGNIWGFPTQVGRGGGAAFVVLYLLCVGLICAPILIAEIAIGRRTQKDPVTAFEVLRPRTAWWLTGLLGVLAGVGILSFYSVIAGWTLAYVWYTATGAVTGSQDAIGAFFGDFVSNGPLSLGLTLVVLVTTAVIIIGGVRSGIERVTRVLMPLLLGLLVLLAARAVTLPGAEAGLAYYMRPDVSRLFDMSVLNAALGQAFFSLSLGMGAMITYGSYLTRRQGIGGAAVWVVLLDTSVALLAGFIIFPAGFSLPGFDPGSGGPGLIFTVLPRLFDTLPGGHLFGAAFFVLLSMAALTSTISLLEVPVSHLIDGHGWTRRNAVLAITTLTAALAIPSALSNGAVGFFSQLPGLGMSFLDFMAIVWNEFALPIGGLLVAIFVGHIWRVDEALAELRAEGAAFPLGGLWGALIRYVCPIAILLIIIFTTLRTLAS